MAIQYKINILDELKNKGFTTYRIRKEKILSEGTLQKFRNNDTTVTLGNIETICKLLDCQPSDIMEYIPDVEYQEKILNLNKKGIKAVKEELHKFIEEDKNEQEEQE